MSGTGHGVDIPVRMWDCNLTYAFVCGPADRAEGTTEDAMRDSALRLGRHLLSLLFPVLTLVFVATGPHRAVESLPGILIVAGVIFIDRRARPARAPAHEGPSWPFTALAVALALVQLLTLALLVRMIARGGWSWDLVLVGWFVGNNSGWGSLVVAHELIHRRSRALRLLGRALLCTVLYDHFFVEHLRGHHVRVATRSRAGAVRRCRRARARRRRRRRRRLAGRRGLRVAGVQRRQRARGGQLLRALGPVTPRRPPRPRRLVGHRLVAHPLHAHRAVAPRRSPRP